MGSPNLGLGRLGRITTATLPVEDRMASPRKGPPVHVVPSKTQPGKFVAREEGAPKPFTRPATQAEAIERGKPVARANQSELVIHGRTGRLETVTATVTIRTHRKTRSTKPRAETKGGPMGPALSLCRHCTRKAARWPHLQRAVSPKREPSIGDRGVPTRSLATGSLYTPGKACVQLLA